MKHVHCRSSYPPTTLTSSSKETAHRDDCGKAIKDGGHANFLIMID